MPYEFRNIDFIETFIRNIGEFESDSDFYARRFGEELEAIVRNRVSQGLYLGGIWGSKPYSTNPIKAYKLGWATVSGEGMNRTLTINGARGSVNIEWEDWYWGEDDRIKKGIPDISIDPSGEHFGESYNKPAPVFIPGYYGWRVDYNGLGSTVDLNFTGNMLDNFNADVLKTRGSNQFGGNYYIDFAVDPAYEGQALASDYYREWMHVTEDEVQQAIEDSGADIARILLL